MQDASPDAYGKVVDRLLASPRYGERMAFRWMEAARYGDTNGYQTDGPRDMWRWRDWVIDAFNRNLPFDRFTIEQLAGDLLPDATLDQRIATGFNRNHRTTGEGGIIPEEYRVEYVADRAQTTSTVWMGLTVGCARCHDHKYDPISQKEFYRLFAYFNRIPNEKGFAWNYGNEDPLVKAPLPEHTQKLAELDRQVAGGAGALRRGCGTVRTGRSPTGWSSNPAGRRPRWPVAMRPRRTARGQPASRRNASTASTTWKPTARLRTSTTFNPSPWRRGSSPRAPNGAIVSHVEDYFEGMGHGLYLVDGKIRLHIHRRFTDLGIRVESVAPVALRQRQHVLVTYDGERKAAGVHIYVNGQPRGDEGAVRPEHWSRSVIRKRRCASARAADCVSREPSRTSVSTTRARSEAASRGRRSSPSRRRNARGALGRDLDRRPRSEARDGARRRERKEF